MKGILFSFECNQYKEFSSFYPAPTLIDGQLWPTVEHYYQAMKTLDPYEREYIRLRPTAWQAKAAGQRTRLRPDWLSVRDQVMKTALIAKFTQHPPLRERLLATGDDRLHLCNPKDSYWGSNGRDRLGELLMEVRAMLRNGEAAGQAGYVDQVLPLARAAPLAAKPG